MIPYFSQMTAKGWKYVFFSLSSFNSCRKNDFFLGKGWREEEKFIYFHLWALIWQQTTWGLKDLSYEDLNSPSSLERSWDHVLWKNTEYLARGVNLVRFRKAGEFQSSPVWQCCFFFFCHKLKLWCRGKMSVFISSFIWLSVNQKPYYAHLTPVTNCVFLEWVETLK